MTVYGLRIRFRVTTSLATHLDELSFTLFDRIIVLRPEGSAPFIESQWLLLTTGNLPSEKFARSLGQKIVLALQYSVFTTGIGFDVGDSLATLQFSSQIRAQFKDQFNVDLRSNVHGLDVFPQDTEAKFVQFSSSGTVSHPAADVIAAIVSGANDATALSAKLQKAITLINSALVSHDPSSRIVLCISAVEMVSQDGSRWSKQQLELLKRLSRIAYSDDTLGALPRREVSEAIVRIYPMGLLQGVRLLLERLALSHRLDEWKEVYGLRSDLVHGKRAFQVQELYSLSDRTVRLCREIVWAVVKAERPQHTL